MAERLQIGNRDASGESENVDDVVDGCEGRDFKGMPMGFTKANCGDGMDDVDDEGEGEMSLSSPAIICGWEQSDAIAGTRFYRDRYGLSSIKVSFSSGWGSQMPGVWCSI